MGLGEQIKLQRQAQGLTQDVLARQSGVALRTVLRIENGEDVRITTIAKVATVLGLGIEMTEGAA